MMKIVERFGTDVPTCCAVCRRHAWFIGYAPRGGARPIWLCDDHVCQSLGRSVYTMPPQKLDKVEHDSSLVAADKAGEYLDEIKQTDVAQLSPDQWRELWRRFIVGFEHEMRRRLLSNEAPF